MLTAALLLKDNVETPSPNTHPGFNNPIPQNIPVVTAPPPLPGGTFQRATPKKRTIFFLKVISFFLIPLVGAVAAFSLTRINQDIRQQAGEGVYNTAVGATGTCTSLTCPSGYSVEQVSGITNVCQCKQTIATTTTTDNSKADGQCLGPGEKCASGVQSFNTSCPVTEAMCGAVPAPSTNKCSVQQSLNCTYGCDETTGNCKSAPIKKAVNDTCSSNSECASNNCLTGPGGKWCAPTGTSIGKVPEGQPCATNAYDRECATGLVCQSNKCIKASEVKTTPVGSCLEDGTSCAGGRGYANKDCSSGIMCGALPTPTPTTGINATAGVVFSAGDNRCVDSQMQTFDGESWQLTQYCTFGCSEGHCNSFFGLIETPFSIAPEITVNQDGDPLDLGYSPRAFVLEDAKNIAINECIASGKTEAVCRQLVTDRFNLAAATPYQPEGAIEYYTQDCFIMGMMRNLTTNVEGIKNACIESRNIEGAVVLAGTVAGGALAAPAVIGAGGEILTLAGGTLSQIPTATYVYASTTFGATVTGLTQTPLVQNATNWWNSLSTSTNPIANLVPRVAPVVGELAITSGGTYGLYQQGQTCGPNPTAPGCDLFFLGFQQGWYDDIAQAANSLTNRAATTVTNQLDNFVAAELDDVFAGPIAFGPEVNTSLDDIQITLYKGIQNFDPELGILPGGLTPYSNSLTNKAGRVINYQTGSGVTNTTLTQALDHALLGNTGTSGFTSWSPVLRTAQRYAGAKGTVVSVNLSLPQYLDEAVDLPTLLSQHPKLVTNPLPTTPEVQNAWNTILTKNITDSYGGIPDNIARQRTLWYMYKNAKNIINRTQEVLLPGVITDFSIIQ